MKETRMTNAHSMSRRLELALVAATLVAANAMAQKPATEAEHSTPILCEIYLIEAKSPVVATSAEAVIRAAQGDLDALLDVEQATIEGASFADRMAAAEKAGALRILAAPQILTSDGESVMAETGIQVPIQTIANNTTTVQYVNAALRIILRPQRSSDGLITLSMRFEKSRPRFDLMQKQKASNPPIESHGQNAELIVRDGGTAVLGGLRTALREDGSLEPIPELVLLVRATLVRM